MSQVLGNVLEVMLRGGTPGRKEDLVDVKSLKEALERKYPAWSKREGDLKGRAHFLSGRRIAVIQ